MAENFKELLDEQRKTNQLLVDSMKDPSLGSSIKQNLGEILNASRLASQGEKFQKREGITEVDEAQKKTTETIAKSSVIQAEQSQGTIFQLVKVQEGISILGTQLNRMLKNMNISRVVDRLKEFSPDPKTMLTAAQQEESDEKNSKNIKNQIDTLKSIDKKSDFLKDIKDGIGKIGKDFLGAAGGAAKRLFQLAGLFGLYKILTDTNLQNLATALDKTVLPALKDLTAFLKDLATNVATFVTDSIKVFGDPDATFMDKVGAAIGLLMLGVIGIYSKAILKYVATFAGVKLLKLAGLSAAVIFSPITAITTGLIGAIVVAVTGLMSGVKEGRKVYKETGSVNKAFEEGMEKMIAFMLGIIPNLVLDAIGFFVGIFNPKLGAKIKGIDVVQFLDDAIDKIQVIFESIIDKVAVALMAIGDYFTRGAFLPKIDDFEGELKRLEDAKERAMDFDTKADLEQQIMKLKRDKKRIDIFEARQERGGVFKGDGDSGAYPDVLNYKGGKISQGQVGLVGELGPELMIPRTDAQIFSARRTEEMIMSALARGMGGGGGGAPVVVTTDNSVRSNTSNMISSPPIVTSNDTFTNAIASSV